MKTTKERQAEATELSHAINFLRDHVSCDGPLGHLPTTDPAVRILCDAIRHLSAARKAVL